MKKVELYWLSSFIHAAPYKGDMRLGSPLSDSPNHVRGLNDLFLGAFDQQGRISVWLSRQSHIFRGRGTLRITL